MKQETRPLGAAGLLKLCLDLTAGTKSAPRKDNAMTLAEIHSGLAAQAQERRNEPTEKNLSFRRECSLVY